MHIFYECEDEGTFNHVRALSKTAERPGYLAYVVRGDEYWRAEAETPEDAMKAARAKAGLPPEHPNIIIPGPLNMEG